MYLVKYPCTASFICYLIVFNRNNIELIQPKGLIRKEVICGKETDGFAGMAGRI